MSSSAVAHPKKNRRDHILPQGFLRGFIDPARIESERPLWYFDVQKNAWSERSTSEVAHGKGFCDYKGNVSDVEHPDITFSELERKYPLVRERIISNFPKWTEHQDFLMRFMQMMRVRSYLFFEQKHKEGKGIEAWQVDSVDYEKNQIKLKSMTPNPLTLAQIKNRTITQMREEIQKGADWMPGFHWVLRYCESPADPFITTEQPLILHSRPSASVQEAFNHPDAMLLFPLCWQACLVASRNRLDIETAKLSSAEMREFRAIYRQMATLFIISPRKLESF